MVIPYKNSNNSKKEQVKQMFNSIAPTYDKLNHILSLGIDKSWRKKAIAKLRPFKPESILDVATGTGELAFKAAQLRPQKITGIDIAENMLDLARKKLDNFQSEVEITFETGDCEALPFKTSSFDAIIVAFGVRNFQNLQKGLDEIYRVLTPNGTFVMLEFSKPHKTIRWIYNTYFFRLLPLIGKLLSHESSAYTYLPESVYNFPDGEKFLSILKQTGFLEAQQKRLSFGIASIYLARKIV